MSQNVNTPQKPIVDGIDTLAIDDFPDAIVKTDLDLKITAWNKAAERLFGWTAAEAIGQLAPVMLPSEFVNSDTVSAIAELQQYGIWQGQHRTRCKDGTTVETSASVVVLRDALGKLAGSIAVSRKLSAEQARQLTIDLREQPFKTLITNASDMIARFDTELRCLYVNPAVSQYTKRPLEQIVGKTLDELGVAPHLINLIRGVVDTIVQTGVGQLNEIAVPIESDIRYFQVRAEPEMKDNKVSTLLLVSRDITDLKKAESKLQRQTKTLAASQEVLEQRVAQRTQELIEAIESEKKSRLFAEQLQVANEALALPLHLEDVLNTIIDCVAALVPYDSACIMLIDQNDRFVPMALRGYERWIDPELFTDFITNTEFVPIRFEEILDGKVVTICDTAQDASWTAYPETTYIRSWMGVPLLSSGKVIGLYSIDRAEPGDFSEMHKSLATAFAPQAGAAIANAQHHASEVQRAEQYKRQAEESANELLQHYRRKSSLNELNLASISYENMGELLARIAQITEQLLPASGGSSIVLWDAVQEGFVTSAASGQAIKGDYAAHRVRHSGGATRWIIEHGKPLIVSDIEEDPFEANPMLKERGLLAYIGVPLLWQDQTIGVLYGLSKTKRNYSDLDVEFLTDLANRAAAVIGKIQLENVLRQANTQLARSSRLKDEFMANMSHELRTPLDAIIARAELLQDGLYGAVLDEQLRPLKVMENSANHLLQLINDILDLSRIETGQIILRPGRIDVETICKASIQFVHERAITKRLKLKLHIDPSAHWLIADELRLKQILVNLLTNAVKFTPAGGKIGLDVIADPEHGVIRFEVWDSGIGIAEEDMDKLFERFSQISSGLTRNFDGVGLGLALVKRLAELHGGYVKVDSTVGEGARFVVTLPLDTHDFVDTLPDSIDVVSAELDQRQRNATILIVDDNVASLDLREEYLTTFGYRVLQAQDGENAIQLAKTVNPDLIIMDIQMPGMDGISAIREMRTHALLEHTPIIAQTALAMPGDEERCLQAGANAYLAKPTAMQTLLNEIDRLLDQQLSY